MKHTQYEAYAFYLTSKNNIWNIPQINAYQRSAAYRPRHIRSENKTKICDKQLDPKKRDRKQNFRGRKTRETIFSPYTLIASTVRYFSYRCCGIGELCKCGSAVASPPCNGTRILPEREKVGRLWPRKSRIN